LPGDNLNTNFHAELRAFTTAQAWLLGFQLPSYAPGPQPRCKGIWSVPKPGVLASSPSLASPVWSRFIRHGPIREPECRQIWLARRLRPVTIKIKTLAAQNTEFWSAFSLIQFKSVCTQIGGSACVLPSAGRLRSAIRASTLSL
jgi:hypothetical protein